MTREELVDMLEILAAGVTHTLVLTPENAADAIALLEPPRPPAFEGWAEIELMGHRQRIAYVREIEIAHRGFLELTWPFRGEEQREIYAASAVFSLAPI